MSLGLAFWILMLILLVGGTYWFYGNHYAMGGGLLQFVLFGLIGWKVFGPPLNNG